MSEEGKIWYGGDVEIPICERNFGQYILDETLKNKDKVAQIDPITNKVLTHGEVRKFSIRNALRMKEIGLRKGDLITVCGRISHLLPIPILSSMYLGITTNILHPDWLAQLEDFKSMISVTQPKAIICDESVLTDMIAMVKELNINCIEVISFEHEFYKEGIYKEIVREDDFVSEEVDTSDTYLCIICSSGTTGAVKPVTVTHSQMFRALKIYSDFIFPDRLLVCYSPLCWISGIYFYLGILLFGARQIVMEYDPDKQVQVLVTYKADWILNSASRMNELVNHPEFQQHPELITNLKYVIFGGSPSTYEQCKHYRKIFKDSFVWNGYGSSEMIVTHALFTPKDRELNEKKVNAQGLPPKGMYWKVVDTETGKMLGYNQKGELWIKGPTITKGYYKNPEATNSAIDEDGFYHTGDLVVIDEDDCLFIVGRYKEVLRYKIWKVSPSDLEEVLLLHTDVIEACVVGKPDPKFNGDLATAFVVKKKGSKLTEEELTDFVNGKVTEPQQLRGGVIFIEGLPKNPAGKVQRRRVQELLVKC